MVNGIKYSIFWDGSSAPLENGLSITRFLTAIEDNFFPGHLLERKDLYFFLDPTEKSNVDKKFEQELLNAGFEIVQARLIGKSDRENEMLVERLGVYREKYKDVEFILISDTQDYPRPILNFLEKNSSHCYIVRARANLNRLACGTSSGKSSFFEETEPSNLPVALVEPTPHLDLSDDDDCSEASCESGEGDIIHPESWVPRYLAIIKYGRDIEKKLLESLKILDVFKGHLNSCTNGIAVVEFSSSEDLKKASPILEGLGKTLGFTMTFVDDTENGSNSTKVLSKNGKSSLSTDPVSNSAPAIKSKRRRGRRRAKKVSLVGAPAGTVKPVGVGKRYVITINYTEKIKGKLNDKLISCLRDFGGKVLTCKDGVGTSVFDSRERAEEAKKFLESLTEFNVKIVSISETALDVGVSQNQSQLTDSRPISSGVKDNSASYTTRITVSGEKIKPATTSKVPDVDKRYVITITFAERIKGELNNKLVSCLRNFGGKVMTCKSGISASVYDSRERANEAKKFLESLTEFNVKIVSINETAVDTGVGQNQSKFTDSRPMSHVVKPNPGPSETKSTISGERMNSPATPMISAPLTQVRNNESSAKFDPEKCYQGLFLVITDLEEEQKVSFYLSHFRKLLGDIKAKPFFVSPKLDWAVLGFQSEDERRSAHIRLAGGGLISGISLNPEPVQSLPDLWIEQMKAFHDNRKAQNTDDIATDGQTRNPPCSVFSLEDLKNSLAVSTVQENPSKRNQAKVKKKPTKPTKSEECTVA